MTNSSRLSEEKMSKEEVQAAAQLAIVNLRKERGANAEFTADEIWPYSGDKQIPSKQRSAASMWLERQGLIHRTGKMQNAKSKKRAGSLTPVYRLQGPEQDNNGSISKIADSAISDLAESGLKVRTRAVATLISALVSKRFLILTGLSGSGKTKLAQAFAHWITPPGTAAWRLVAVGADWTSNERIVGYPDHLNGVYVRTPALDLMLRARDNPDTPHFLILDEMNLSHVERYFADLLSAMESPEAPMSLHRNGAEMGGVPAELKLPDNLFIIGTVNVDETTYLFSPKVLDRANVIEFRASRDDLSAYLDNAGSGIDIDALDGAGDAFGSMFVNAARQSYVPLSETDQHQLKAELMLLFDTLAEHGSEFGFRVAREIARFVAFYKEITGESKGWFEEAIDAQIAQKILPKLNGSRAKLAGVLWSLSVLCHESQRPAIDSTGLYVEDETWRKLKERLTRAARADTESENPARALDSVTPPRYPLSADKLARMWRVLEANGFVSFTEA